VEPARLIAETARLTAPEYAGRGVSAKGSDLR